MEGDTKDCLSSASQSSSSLRSSTFISLSPLLSPASAAGASPTLAVPSSPLFVQLSSRQDDGSSDDGDSSSSSSSKGSSVPIGVIIPVVLFGVVLLIILVGWLTRRSHSKATEDGYAGQTMSPLDGEGISNISRNSKTTN